MWTWEVKLRKMAFCIRNATSIDTYVFPLAELLVSLAKSHGMPRGLYSCSLDQLAMLPPETAYALTS